LNITTIYSRKKRNAKFDYPRGVIALSSIEMWERFSFYTMQSLLVLYASAKVLNGGLGWSEADALRLVGYYGAFVYVSPIIGGVVADKVIGRKLAVFLGSLNHDVWTCIISFSR
jgi:POT family proton-dependent oligopeptide transporter